MVQNLDATETTRGVIDRFNEAFNQHDVDGIMALMTEDCVFENTSPVPDASRHVGVGVTAHHVAYDYPILTDVLQALAQGESRPQTTQMIDELNTEHARQFAGCGQAETVELLRRDGEATADAIRSLDDASLDQTHELPFLGNQPVTLEHFLQVGFIQHHDAHLPSIRAAVPSAARLKAG